MSWWESAQAPDRALNRIVSLDEFQGIKGQKDVKRAPWVAALRAHNRTIPESGLALHANDGRLPLGARQPTL